MNNSINKRRLLTVPVIISLVIVFWFACTVRVNAAATKTINVVTEMKVEQKTDDGSGYTYSSKYVYYKTGLLKSVTDDEGWKTEWKRDKAGNVTNLKYYNGDGRLTSERIYKYKKGKRTTSSYYSYSDDGKKTLIYKVKYTVKKGKITKADETDAESGNKTTTTYYSNGNPQKVTSDHVTITYDKNGNITSYKYTFKNEETNTVYEEKTKYTNTYKKGRLTKVVEKSTYSNGTDTDKSTVTIKYKYTVKGGNVTKRVATTSYKNSDGGTSKTTSTTTYKYKKVKLAKKYWNVID